MSICRRPLSGMDLLILRQLENGPLTGLAHIAEELGGADCRYVRERLRWLECHGLVNVKYTNARHGQHKLKISKGTAAICTKTIPGIC